MFLQKSSILWVLLWRGFNSLSHVENKLQFFVSCWKKVLVLWVISEKFNPLYHITKIQSFLWVISEKVQSCGSYFQKRSSILWVTLEKNNSLSHLEKKMFNSMSHFGEKDVQFCESYSKKNSARHIREKRCSILCVIYSRKRDVQFCASNWKRGSMLWVNFKSLSHIQKISILWVTF